MKRGNLLNVVQIFLTLSLMMVLTDAYNTHDYQILYFIHMHLLYINFTLRRLLSKSLHSPMASKVQIKSEKQ